jgi:3-hydroxy-9,10-secoandrosta-1,3,5(10)-triene-9,17-dione monooxygenase reductase component
MSSAALPADEFRRACARFATGVCVLTTCTADGTPHGLTVNSFSSLSLEPPLVMVSIAFSSHQLPIFEKADFFAVNILTEAQQHLSTHFARRLEGRFTGIEWKLGQTGSPVFEDTLGVIECRVVQRYDTGDHRLLIGEAVATRMHQGRPLLFFESRYGVLA